MTPSRPARAMRDAAMLLVLVLALRVPAIERRFAAALLAAADAPAARAAHRRLAAVAQLGRPVAAPASATMDAPQTVPAQLVLPPRRPPAATGKAPPAVIAAVDTFGLGPMPELAAVPLSLNAVALHTGATDAAGMATAAYARLAAGDRRGAVRLFDAALAGDDPRQAQWRRQRDALTRHWSGSAYSIVRGDGPAGFAVEPVLGGGQSGAALAFTPDPLSPRPLAVTVRGSFAHDDPGRSAFAAVGVQWHPLTGVTVAAERLIAIGPAAENAWTARVAAGTDRTFGRLRAAAYGEGGIIGHATYAAVQGRAAAIFHVARLEIDPGAGVWSSLQRDRGVTLDRVDVGPGVVVRTGPVAAELDYRARVAGHAAPGSGPVLTLSAAF